MNQVKMVLYFFSFLDHTSFMVRMNLVLLSYRVQDIFEDYSSNHAKRDVAKHGTVFFQGRF